MLSFDVSAIDIVLVIAVLTMFALYVKKKPGASRTETRSQVEEIPKLQDNPRVTSKTQKFKTHVKQPQTSFQNCAHHFGYLRNLPQGTPVPDECFNCQKIRQCLFQSE